MTEMTANFLNLLFDKGETISVSPNKYGYHSVEQNALDGDIVLVSPNEEIEPLTIKESDINLIAINPIKGFRRDENVTTFRSFMVEIDTGTLEEQRKYIEASGLPYSACVFSGNKSLHYAIVLDEPMVTINMWRFYNRWILNILAKTDQQIKNPSRSLRFPGNRRHNGKKLMQSLVTTKGRVSQEDFFRWLFAHEDKKPIQRVERFIDPIQGMPDVTKIPTEVVETLGNGVIDNRNATWFYIGCRMSELGFDLDQTIAFLSQFFQEESSFKKREWEGCLKSAYRRVNGAANV